MSNLGSYFFGNVDPNGNLDADFDEELKLSLSKINEEGAEKLFGNMFSFSGIDVNNVDGVDEEELGEEQRKRLAESLAKAQVRPLADANDYFDFTELADDTEKARYYQQGMESMSNSKDRTRKFSSRDFDEDYDEDEEEPKPKNTKIDITPTTNQSNGTPVLDVRPLPQPTSTSQVIEPPEPVVLDKIFTLQDVQKAYPAFEPNSILKFSELFANPNFFNKQRGLIWTKKVLAQNKKRTQQLPKMRESTGTKDQFETDPEIPVTSQKNHLEELIEICRHAALSNKVQKNEPEIKDVEDEILKGSYAPDTYLPVELEPWEDNIIYDFETLPEAIEDTESVMKKVIAFHNHELEEGDWENQIFYDEEEAKQRSFPVLLDLNDTNMLFEVANADDNSLHAKGEETSLTRLRLLKKAKKLGIKGISFAGSKGLKHQQLDRFNLSNDLYYEAIKSGKAQRVRQTFGQIVVQHSAVALKLQQPFFKNRLTKADLRRWHRPAIHFPIGVELKFTRAKPFKKKKLKLKPNEEFVETPKDITLKDSAPFVLLEYSEEFPPIIQNVGMGSILMNYYRKKDQDDDYIHDPDIGEPTILDPTDVSPFMNFGNVEPGEFKMGLYNNLLKAPVFHHDARPNDFLLIKFTLKGKTKYYLRKVTDVYVAGQTYPQQDVPGPHSRRITATIKNRLQVAAYRLINKSPKKHLKIQRLARYFPEYNEGQIRTKLKEFAEFQRTGPSVGFWKLKPHITLPDEEELRKMATPEMLCLYESMLVGKRHLQDAGYGKSAEEDKDDDNELSLTIEEQLAPWITTRNFINATQGKAMLKLYGEGDPTGRGEGFSFVRVSMKDIFLRAGESAEEKLAEIEARPKSAHRYNVAEQQQIYREEITRIWNTQNTFLANSNDFPLTDDDSDEDLDINRRGPLDLSAGSVDTTAMSPSQPSPMDHASVPDTNTKDQDDISVQSANSNKSTQAQPKVLVVKRKIVKNGHEEWVQETIRNPAVIKAYIRRRDNIKPPNATDPIPKEIIKAKTQDLLDRVRKSRERRLAKLKAQEAIQGGTIPSHLAPRGKKELIRRCGNCGELGHMKTNRKCPKYAES